MQFTRFFQGDLIRIRSWEVKSVKFIFETIIIYKKVEFGTFYGKKIHLQCISYSVFAFL